MSRAPLLLLLLVPVLAFARFQDDYSEGKEAIEDGDWDKALASLRAAVAQNPTSAERVRIYGMRFEPYVPHYYIGRALFEKGDCAGALDAWREAETQGPIRGLDEYADLQRDRGVCESQVVDVTAIAESAGNGIQALDDAVKDLERVKGQSLLAPVWSQESGWQRALNDGKAAVTSLQRDLRAAVGAKDADAIEAIAQQAEALRTQVMDASGAAGQRLTQLRAAEDQRVAEAERQATSRRELLQTISGARGVLDDPAPDAASQRVRQELAALVQRSDNLGSNASVADLNQASRNINAKIREFRQAVQTYQVQQQAIARRTPPASLKRIAEAYFGGDYGRTVELADPRSFSDQREKIQAHLFRAAANFNQFKLGGESDSSLMAQVQQDVRAIKGIDSRFRPYVAAFPPKFSELFSG